MACADRPDRLLQHRYRLAPARIPAPPLWPYQQEPAHAGRAVDALRNGETVMEYLIVKWLHVLSSTLLFGTGIGSAWYLLFAVISKNVQAIAVVTRILVIADWLFTGVTMIAQPATGFYLIHLAGFP